MTTTVNSNALSNNEATPEEVIAKVHQAAQLLINKGEAGLNILRDNTSEFTWKDTYIFVIDVEGSVVLSNPAFKAREGGNIREHLDWNNKFYGKELCTLSQNGGGWMEFVWPKPGLNEGQRKVSYIYPIPGYKYTVCAGIYNDTKSIDELNALTKRVLNQESSPVIVLFEVKPTVEGKPAYLKMAADLKIELAKAAGFISGERYESLNEAGKLLSVNIWENEACMNQWRNNAMHRMSQKAGHDKLFEKYTIKVVSVIRDYSMTDRKQAPEDSNQYIVGE